MKTLINHIDNLSRYCKEDKREILQSILHNQLIMDETSLFSYYTEHNQSGYWLTVMWLDGDGDTILKWFKELVQKEKFDKIYFVSNRWKAFQRRVKEIKIKPLGVLCELEVI